MHDPQRGQQRHQNPEDRHPVGGLLADGPTGETGHHRTDQWCERYQQIRCFHRLAPQMVEIFDVDGMELTEQHDQDRQADGRFGRRHRQDEEHEDLAGQISHVV